MGEIDETIIPRHYPIAVKLLERRKREIMDCIERIPPVNSNNWNETELEFIELREQLKATNREIWYLTNI